MGRVVGLMSNESGHGRVDASEAFEYLPVAGMHSRWVVWVDDESTLSSYERLSDVEAEIETWVDETLESP